MQLHYKHLLWFRQKVLMGKRFFPIKKTLKCEVKKKKELITQVIYSWGKAEIGLWKRLCQIQEVVAMGR